MSELSSKIADAIQLGVTDAHENGAIPDHISVAIVVVDVGESEEDKLSYTVASNMSETGLIMTLQNFLNRRIQ